MEDNSRIIKTEYSEEMQKSFINYAMSVIIARALPDIRDGLKPVQRVLYMTCMSWVSDMTSPTEKARELSAILWVNIIPTETAPSMIPWLS